MTTNYMHEVEKPHILDRSCRRSIGSQVYRRLIRSIHGMHDLLNTHDSRMLANRNTLLALTGEHYGQNSSMDWRRNMLCSSRHRNNSKTYQEDKRRNEMNLAAGHLELIWILTCGVLAIGLFLWELIK